MVRIPADQVERIESDISLLRLVESQGYQPKKQGKDTQESAYYLAANRGKKSATVGIAKPEGQRVIRQLC